MSDSRKDKELILPPPVNNESDGLRVKEAVANKEKETASAAAAASSSSSSSSSSSTTALTESTSTTTFSSSSLASMDDEDSTTAHNSSSDLESATASSTSRASPKKTPKKSLTKCTFCNKKTGLNGFVCRCGDNFCALHRLPEKHACTFDFQSRGKESIQRDNPLVQRSKVSAI